MASSFGTPLWVPPDFSIHGICLLRILKWVVISFSRVSSQSRDQTNVSCIGRRIVYHWGTWEKQQQYINVEKNEIMTFARAWIHWEGIKWNKSEREKQILYVYIYIYIWFHLYVVFKQTEQKDRGKKNEWNTNFQLQNKWGTGMKWTIWGR